MKNVLTLEGNHKKLGERSPKSSKLLESFPSCPLNLNSNINVHVFSRYPIASPGYSMSVNLHKSFTGT